MPLPPPVIQTRPAGLLSLLGLQNGGRTPETLVPYTQPVFELSDWYLRARRQYLASGNVAIPNGSQAAFVAHTGIVVPNNQWWWVESLSASISAQAGDSLQAGWAIGIQNQAVSFAVSPQGLAVPSTSAGFLSVASPIWLGPGSQVGLLVSNNVTAVSLVTAARLIYSPLDI